jgi:ActR/RegA family two-component response regulator
VVTLVTAGGLICEDDSGSRRALSAILVRRGFSVLATVDSAEELLRAASGVRADVILLELDLAGVAGLGIIPALRAAAPRSAIVLLSPFDGLRAAAIEAGAFDFVDPSDLRDLDRCLEGLRPSRRVGSDGDFPPAGLGPD